ncbi:hypothetical protein AYO20_11307 [Fonsecaea nubica]|uniref:TauD/TfdA-like domain-containing protein n=1 Tax=Fonsecaea nubica TaxID=856822 RepID=A0A178BW77_9EURO|nr:hypothetical protein AYO20_11307 [Fonsecaea nubica]OAL21878.1 hypothetical protein AYO20_11307 [Fonsecaea nubica]
MATAATLQPASALQYVPSAEDRLRHTLHPLANSSSISEQLPDGFPSHISSPLAWDSGEMSSKAPEWTLRLSADDITSIEDALAGFKELEIPWRDLSPKSFAVSEDLRKRLENAALGIHGAPGFVLVRGLEPRRYSIEDCIIIQAGLTSYIGSTRGYNGPSGADVLSDDIVSPTFTNKAMTMHTDLGDVVSLFTVHRGSEGGSFRLVSSATIYNKLAVSNPGVLRTLSEDFVFDTLHPEVPSYKKPLLHYHDGKVILQSFRRPFSGFGNIKRSVQLPPLSDRQVFALNELYFQAMDLSMKIDFQNGDLLLFHNMALLHSRDTYKPDENSPRHLLKMFVRSESLGWKIPPVLEDQWEELYGSRTVPHQEDFPPEPPFHAERVPYSGWAQNG